MSGFYLISASLQKGCCLVVGALVALTAMEDSAPGATTPFIVRTVDSPRQVEESWPPGPALLRWIPEKAPRPTFLRDGEVSFFLGARLLDDPIFQQLEAATQAGVAATVGPRTWWVRPYVGLAYARAAGAYKRPSTEYLRIEEYYEEPDERGNLTVSFFESDVGGMSTWSLGPFQHHIGGGLCLVRANIQETPQKTIYLSILQREVTPRQDSDTNIGWWVSTSITTTVSGVLIGVEGRLTDSQVTLFEQPVQAGGLQVGATAIWVW